MSETDNSEFDESPNNLIAWFQMSAKVNPKFEEFITPLTQEVYSTSNLGTDATTEDRVKAGVAISLNKMVRFAYRELFELDEETADAEYKKYTGGQ